MVDDVDDNDDIWDWVSIKDNPNPKKIGHKNKLYDIKYYTKYNKKSSYKAWRKEIKVFGTKDEIMLIVNANKYNI